MSVATDLRAYMLSKSSVTNLVGQRIYQDFCPQGAFADRIIFSNQGGARTRSLSGPSGQANSQFTIDCQSESQDSAKSIAAALVNILECYQGTSGSTVFQGIFVEPPGDNVDPPVAANEKPIYTTSLNAEVWYDEAVPTYV